MYILFLLIYLLQTDISAPVRISSNADRDQDPSLVRASDGRFYAVWSSKRRSGVHLYIKSSEDGRTWSGEEPITSGAGENYYPSLIQARTGTFHLAWFRLDKKQRDMDIWYSNSRDARNWSEPVQITHDSAPDWAPSIHEDSHGVLRIVWSSSQSGNRELFMVRSENRGVRWSSEQQITQSPEEDDFPHLIETPQGQWILVWTRYRRGSKLLSYTKDASAEIVVARSDDGLKWSKPEVCSPPDEKQTTMDLLPFVFTDSRGEHVYIAWTSSRSGRQGDILLRDMAGDPSNYRRLTTDDKSDYDAKIVETRRPGEYLMVWVSNRDGKAGIYSQIFRPN